MNNSLGKLAMVAYFIALPYLSRIGGGLAALFLTVAAGWLWKHSPRPSTGQDN